jgi:hypothetical protein
MSPQIWVPGVEGPHEEFVSRLHRAIAAEGENVVVSVELADGSLFQLESISPEPGWGFITLKPHSAEDEPVAVIVPLGAIAQFRLSAPEARTRPGFSLPSGA